MFWVFVRKSKGLGAGNVRRMCVYTSALGNSCYGRNIYHGGQRHAGKGQEGGREGGREGKKDGGTAPVWKLDLVALSLLRKDR